eukprot:6204940-Pyramimonas_sp.AAC.1
MVPLALLQEAGLPRQFTVVRDRLRLLCRPGLRPLSLPRWVDSMRYERRPPAASPAFCAHRCAPKPKWAHAMTVVMLMC